MKSGFDLLGDFIVHTLTGALLGEEVALDLMMISSLKMC